MKSTFLAQQEGVSSVEQFPLSVSQSRVWALEQLHGRNPAQNLTLGLVFQELAAPEKIQSALDAVIEQHEVLRAEFRATEGIPRQVVRPRARVAVDAIDLRQFSAREREPQLSRLAEEESRNPFDLSSGPLVRAKLFHLDDAKSALLITVHRIVCDPISLRLLLEEIASHYRGRGMRDAKGPAQARLQYRDFAKRESDLSEQQLSYWKRQLAGVSTTSLPADRPRPPVQSFRGAQLKKRIEAPSLQRLRHLSEQYGVTLFTTLVAGFNALLLRYSRQGDIVVGTRVSGRGQPGTENLIGPLENMLALRTDVSDDPTFVALLTRVHQVTRAAFSHQDIPFETLVKELDVERDLSRHPLFQITFTGHDAPEGESVRQSELTFYEVNRQTEQFDLSVEWATRDNQLEMTYSYNCDLLNDSTVARMTGHFERLLGSAAENPELKISQLLLLTEAERHQVLVEWNDTQVPFPLDRPLHQFIEDQVEKTPESTAVIYESQQLTYRQLNNRANQLANYLRKRGVGPDVLVGVFAERSLEMVIALLAILKAGGAYVPLDPEYPRDRLETMLRDADPPVVLTQAHLLNHLPASSSCVFCLDRDWPLLASEDSENLPVTVGGKNLAYAIYTSGSTGKPKGVPNVHAGIVNRLLWMQEMYKLTSQDRVLQKTPFSFDVSVWEFFWPLMAGATLVVARPGGHRDPGYLVSLIAEQGITTLHFVPSMLNVFLEAPDLRRCRSLRRVFASGEALTFELQQRFFERFRAELHNLYGPTEAAVDVTYWKCQPNREQTIVPIGRPIANIQIYILDSNVQPVPIGVAGELHIGGIGLARGYLNRPDLTAEKFIPNPFTDEPGSRLYKTGDLARFLSDGNIEYLGRIDHQVKLRGFRIELGEIEAVLEKCSGVRQAVVVVREDQGDKQLVAYLLATRGGWRSHRLRRELAEKLPEYMVPSRFVLLEAFPMTTSGKVDRKALPPPPPEEESSTAAVAPRNELESRLAAIFASILGRPSVGVTDNFFHLGGHSLMAACLVAKVQEIMGRQIPLSALFRGGTVESLARLLEHETESSSNPVIMEIQRGDPRWLPFFAIVPPGEESLGYAMLAQHMGPEKTIYKVQGHTPVTGGKRPYSEQEMQALTEECIAAIRTVQPHGPYCLGGLCDGTHIAEQIVLRLESQNEKIGLFAIFDTWVLQHSQRRWLWKVYYFGQRFREMKKLNLAERLASYKRVAESKVQRLVGSKPPRTDWQQAYWPANFKPPRFRAPIVLFKRPKQPFYYVNDPQMGWGVRSEGGVETHEIDFPHMHILREPHVRFFGEKLAEHLERISRRNRQARQAVERESPVLTPVDGHRDRPALPQYPTTEIPRTKF